ncbi:putative nuclear transport factor 2 domain protein [Phaeomoniella chlamydospora]|uniref:Putative nuclear transport factor 2 domain protein n=1 Tax=Phaeomoniella chlamydospora TaxID=158046 RepID=A0A0G2H145_PHACM|nr:putative nuclear transport factor 2 domain protein [Phaeomoniella chlamydospora]
MASRADLVKISADAAERFVDDYYKALSKQRNTIATFYVETPAADTILFNGNALPDGIAVQEIFDTQMPPAQYEIQSVDCHVINPAFVGPDTPADAKSPKQQPSILVLISGWVSFSEERSEPQRGFSETLVLVPNPQAEDAKGGKSKQTVQNTELGNKKDHPEDYNPNGVHSLELDLAQRAKHRALGSALTQINIAPSKGRMTAHSQDALGAFKFVLTRSISSSLDAFLAG